MNIIEQSQKIRTGCGFIAALDQSGGSTPGALCRYGIKEGAWSSDEEMLRLVHEMRTRIITSPSFDGERVLGAILFEDTIDREIGEQPTADYLWNVKRVVPFLKIDKGLEAERDGVQLMKPIPQLQATLNKAKGKNIFGTKMRSVIKQAQADGIRSVVGQQFDFATYILQEGLVPIVEPEIDIHCPSKLQAELVLRSAIENALEKLPSNQQVILKLTLPEENDFFACFVGHPRVARVAALSGGYTREEANVRLRLNHGLVASFSRALLEGLTIQQSDNEFNSLLNASIQSIFEASQT